MDGKMKTSTIPKGYRLKPSTHKLIKALQKKLKLSQEKVIRTAVRFFYKDIKITKHEIN